MPSLSDRGYFPERLLGSKLLRSSPEGLLLLRTINPEEPDVLRISLVHDCKGIAIRHADHETGEISCSHLIRG